MSTLSDIAESVVGMASSTLVGPFAKIIDKILPDPQAAAEAKLRLAEMAQKGELAQLDAETRMALAQTEINKIEASDESFFVRGWRPTCAWSCVFGLMYNFSLHPVLSWVSAILQIPSPPQTDVSTTFPLLIALLGLGGYRTYEKVKKAQ